MNAQEIARKAASLVGGDRAKTHGDKTINHENIARLWQAYLDSRPTRDRLTALDAALMMVLLKVARTQLGSFNPDDYIDMCGYAAVAGDIAHVLTKRDDSEAKQGDSGPLQQGPRITTTKLEDIYSGRSPRQG